MPPKPLFAIDGYDFDNPLFDQEAIRSYNPQRFEMEQLNGVVHVDVEAQGLVGFKDVTEDEFWINGHMPGFPLMPGVVQCECGAQLAGFFARKYNLMPGDYLGFGGIKDVRFRSPVYPNSRLVLAAQVTRIRKNRRVEFDFQGFVDGKMAFSGAMIGVPIIKDPDAAVGAPDE